MTRTKRIDDRLQPHDLTAEQSVLGSVLIDRDAIITLAPILKPSDFFRHAHSVIYQAMLDLYWRRTPTDLVTLIAELDRTDKLDSAGGEAYLAELIAATPTAVHAEYYAGIVKDHATRRAIITAGQEIVRQAWDASRDLGSVVTGSEVVLGDAVRGYSLGEFASLDDVISHYIATMDDPPAARLLFGMPSLDHVVQGITGGQLIVTAGLTGFGKSALALQWAVHNAVNCGQSVAIRSLEMSDAELGHRALAIHTGINSRKIAAGALSADEREIVRESAAQLSDSRLMFLDRSITSVERVVAVARNIHSTQGLNLLIVDYLQLLSTQRKSSGRTEEVGYLSRSLKTLAVELDIPVIALAQLNRAPWTRTDPTPVLSDLRESGSIEQDANLVVFLHKPGFFDNSYPDDLVRLIVAKNRSGPLGSVVMRFDKRTTRFFETTSEARRAA